MIRPAVALIPTTAAPTAMPMIAPLERPREVAGAGAGADVTLAVELLVVVTLDVVDVLVLVVVVVAVVVVNASLAALMNSLKVTVMGVFEVLHASDMVE